MATKSNNPEWQAALDTFLSRCEQANQNPRKVLSGFELVHRYETDPGFRRKLEDYVFERTYIG